MYYTECYSGDLPVFISRLSKIKSMLCENTKRHAQGANIGQDVKVLAPPTF